MPAVGLVVEGTTDQVAVERIFADLGATTDPARTVVTNGKTTFDARIESVNQASRYMPWFALRDLDHDADGCAVRLRASLLKSPANPGLCLRIAARTLEAWLLADADAISSFFDVPFSRIPREPERLDSPKETLVHLCRSSSSRDVKRGMVPPDGAAGTGPGYTGLVSTFCTSAWRPDVASESAPSLARRLGGIRTKIETGAW